MAASPTETSKVRVVVRPRQSSAPLAPSTAVTVTWATPVKPAAVLMLICVPLTTATVTLGLSLAAVMKAVSPASGSVVTTLTAVATPLGTATGAMGWMTGAWLSSKVKVLSFEVSAGTVEVKVVLSSGLRLRSC